MAGGLGTRMRSETPKHLHPLLGRRLIDWVLEAARAIDPDPLIVVTSEATKEAIAGAGTAVVVQPEARGTGDAVASARSALEGFDGDVLVLSGDSPLLTPELLEGLVEEPHRKQPPGRPEGLAEAHHRKQAAVTVRTFEATRPLPYGRVVRDGAGNVSAIVEEP